MSMDAARDRLDGRHPKLKPDVVDAIVLAVRGGAYFKDACLHAGVTESTGHKWKRYGDQEEPPARHERDSDNEYAQRLDRWRLARQFAERVAKAEADAKVAAIARIQRAGTEGVWYADAWYLERKYPGEFGRRVLEVSGPDGGPIEFVDARERLVELIERLASGVVHEQGAIEAGGDASTSEDMDA